MTRRCAAAFDSRVGTSALDDRDDDKVDDNEPATGAHNRRGQRRRCKVVLSPDTTPLPGIGCKDIGPCHPTSIKFVRVELVPTLEMPPFSGEAAIALIVGRYDGDHQK